MIKEETKMEETYLTPKEAAFIMGVSQWTIYRWLKAGLIKGKRKGERLLFVPQSEVLRVKRG